MNALSILLVLTIGLIVLTIGLVVLHAGAELARWYLRRRYREWESWRYPNDGRGGGE